MIDIHSHLIFGVDDGPRTIDDSLRMLDMAEKIGIKVIIATPHYYSESVNIETVEENYNALLSKASDFDVAVKLGSEISIYPLLEIDIKKEIVPTLGGSNHILIEFPYGIIPYYTKEMLFNLQVGGITTVVAHPERSRCFLSNIDIVRNYQERGYLFQVDSASMMGKYGKKVRKYTQDVIRKNLVHFVASDAHCPEDYSQWYLQSFELTRRWAGELYAEKLFFRNAKEIIDSTKNMVLKSL